jgi:predicted nicotinamide N-methyase
LYVIETPRTKPPDGGGSEKGKKKKKRKKGNNNFKFMSASFPACALRCRGDTLVVPTWWPEELLYLPSIPQNSRGRHDETTFRVALAPIPLLSDSILSVVLANPEVDVRGDDEPYWSVLWPSSQALAAYLETTDTPQILGSTFLDIGCGTGVAGVAAALKGSSKVVLADISPRALQLALLTVAANGILPDETSMLLVGLPIEPMRLLALHGSAAFNIRKNLRSCNGAKYCHNCDARGRVSAVLLDWRRPLHEVLMCLEDEPFSVVLAGDVLYGTDTSGDAAFNLAELLPALVSPGGHLILADSQRYDEVDAVQRFLSMVNGAVPNLEHLTDAHSDEGVNQEHPASAQSDEGFNQRLTSRLPRPLLSLQSDKCLSVLALARSVLGNKGTCFQACVAAQDEAAGASLMERFGECGEFSSEWRFSAFYENLSTVRVFNLRKSI